MNPRVKAVVPKDDYKLEISFTNGEVGIFDCSKLLNFGVFKELADIDYFRKANVRYGTVAWPNEQDICPDTLYEDSIRNAAEVAELPAQASGGRGAAIVSRLKETGTVKMTTDQIFALTRKPG